MALFLAGLILGVAQLALLCRLVRAISRPGGGLFLWGMAQIILPAVLFTGCAVFLPGHLLWAAVGFVASLMTGAVVIFARGMASARRTAKRGGP